MRTGKIGIGVALALQWFVCVSSAAVAEGILAADSFQTYIEQFNRDDVQGVATYVTNQSAQSWLRANIPLFECSDKLLEEMYYFRWWTFRKHIKETRHGFVITEFLPPVPWAGEFNTISCSAAHHFYDGRWLRDRKYLADYAKFWFRNGGDPRRYSFAAADALRAWSLVTQDQYLSAELLPELVANYEAWKQNNQDPNGLYWQIDDRDGMEYSVGGSGYRPTINSYQFGDAVAISEIAGWAFPPRNDLLVTYREKAEKLRILVETMLWNETDSFYETLPRGDDHALVGVRELVGYVPWYFGLPKPGREAAWRQVLDPEGFRAPYGPTTVERRNPQFMLTNPHECLWNGPSWPFATSQTLTAMANLLNHYRQPYVSKGNFLELLRTYARSQHLRLPDGRMIPFIDEDLNPDTGEWIARQQLLRMPAVQQREKGGAERGRDYNHSTFNDLIITGLVGLRPRLDDWLEVNPLVPEGVLEYFCLDRVRYRDRDLTILYDRTGTHYGKGRGLHLFANGREIGSATGLTLLMAKLPSAEDGWIKYDANPLVGGGKLGTVFDIAVLHEAGKYRMWGSWRPKRSLALFESTDGIHWSEPKVVLSPNAVTDWESDINRPSVVHRADGYHLWYTGQAHGRSWIGYATSPDGLVWTRMSDKPVLSAEMPWEKNAVMCPNVLWDERQNLFRMWYSGGDQYEPDAIGYATSPDGLHWSKYVGNPILKPDPQNVFEQYKVAGAQVLHWKDWYYAVYIGYRDMDHAQISIARSHDGLTNWERHPRNPIIRPGQDDFDQDACYKPYMLFDGKQWLMWYNGRHGSLEQIGLALHAGQDLGFNR